MKSLEMKGIFSVVSKRSEFSLIRQRGDLFRLDYLLQDVPAIRARDTQGPWMLNAWLKPEIGRVTEDPYKSQLERESLACVGAWARFLRAGIARLKGDDVSAAALLGEAGAISAEHDMPFCAAVAARRRGQLIGGDEGEALVKQAEESMRGDGVVNPERMSDVVAPGFAKHR